MGAGFPVRAVARRSDPLRALAADGAEVMAMDLTDLGATRRALEGIDQVVTTANNVMGSGRSSPHRVDVLAYRTLTQAMREAGTRRLIHVSARNIGPDSVVDFFRVKHAVDSVICASGVPYVLLQFSALMDVWTSVVLGDDPVPTVATLFGGGIRRLNFIAVADASRCVVAVALDASVAGETIAIGGPSDASLGDLASFAERALGTTLRRRVVPVPVLRVARLALRPFSERVARMVSLAYFSTQRDRPFPEWRAAAERFSVAPRTLESYLADRYQPGSDAGRAVRS